ncbi:MAG: hypothetical protein KJO07_22775 [Deltaproteobacteria bacterium]|nr:hypothetical protein [Deltaproteobacteria bacterium]
MKAGTPAPDRERPETKVPKLRREAIIPILPRQWLWTYLLIKVMVVSMAIATMSMIAR